MNVKETSLDCQDISYNISKKYHSDIYEDINLFKSQLNDDKLRTF